MKPIRLRIKNYRSIKSEIVIPLDSELSFVGPNNSGKTNILKAIQLFFSGYENSPYDIVSDLPFDSAGGQTSITMYFSFESGDELFAKLYSSLLGQIEGEKKIGNEIPLFLYFSGNGKPVYKFFSNDKIKPKLSQQFQRLHAEALDSLLGSFSCKYIPSEKSANYIYEAFLLPFIRKSISDVLSSQIDGVRKELGYISEKINGVLAVGGLGNIRSEFKVPGLSMESLLSKFDFYIDDGVSTKVEHKGAGIQAATLLAAFRWINSKEILQGRRVIWLIEEPESYLHPGLAYSCKKILSNVAEDSHVIVTTHSMAFVNHDPLKVLETRIDAGETKIASFSTYSDATLSIRSALGLRFSDFYNLADLNVFVEGKSDREIIKWALDLIVPKGRVNQWGSLRRASVLDFSGISKLADFLKSSYAFMQKERAIVVMVDGDDAGVNSIKTLSGYFGQKEIKFVSGEDYVILPNGLPIEGLFPHDWLKDIYRENSNWFQRNGLKFDLDGRIVDISIKDDYKKTIQTELMERGMQETKRVGNYSWASSFVRLFNALDQILARKSVF